jgi:hypothetical protein
MDTRYPPAGMTDEPIWITPDASRLLSSHAYRVTAADGLTRRTYATAGFRIKEGNALRLPKREPRRIMGKRAIDEVTGQTDARRGCLEPGQCFDTIGLVAVENQI